MIAKYSKYEIIRHVDDILYRNDIDIAKYRKQFDEHAALLKNNPIGISVFDDPTKSFETYNPKWPDYDKLKNIWFAIGETRDREIMLDEIECVKIFSIEYKNKLHKEMCAKLDGFHEAIVRDLWYIRIHHNIVIELPEKFWNTPPEK